MADEKLTKAYESVFDTQGNVRVCGRKACITLIEECEKKDSYTYFGNKENGRMDIEAIKRFYEKEMSKEE